MILILSVSGEAKTGKTTFGYTAPLTIVGFSFDIGADRAIKGIKYDYFKDLDEAGEIDIQRWVTPEHKPSEGAKFKNEITDRITWHDHSISIYEFPTQVQITDRVVGVREQWQAFLTLFQTACLDDKVRTVVIDTGSLARRVAADAWLQTIQEDTDPARKQLIEIEWGKPNQAIRDVYNLARACDKNLIMIHHLRDERKPRANARGQIEFLPTGKREYEGLRESDRIWDVGIRTKKTGGNISFEYETCGYNLALENSPVAGDTWDTMVAQIDGSLGNRIGFERRNGK